MVIDCCLSYCHYSLNDTSLIDSDFIAFLENRGIAFLNASAMSMGLLTKNGPPFWHPATDRIKQTCKMAVDYCNSQNVDISKLALYFSLANSRIPGTLVSMHSLEEVASNIAVIYQMPHISEFELAILEHIRNTFLIPLNNATWKGIEVEKYHNFIKNQSL